MKIKVLEWDSLFFNKKIGEINFDARVRSFTVPNEFDLLYVKQSKDEFLELDGFRQTFVETKVVFSKSLSKSTNPTDGFIISVFDAKVEKEIIYNLAFESGKFSRFRLDSNFKQSEFKNLYKTWVDNSFTKEFAADIVVYRKQNCILGFATYKVFRGFATIGLIGVSPEYQGEGIGRKLLEAVENELLNNKIKELRIPTQLKNEIACRFYERLGYKIIERKIIKHYWKI
jgi:dTDP-4-amino-4,6-dideoxy-D-galactose acyltransferase